MSATEATFAFTAARGSSERLHRVHGLAARMLGYRAEEKVKAHSGYIQDLGEQAMEVLRRFLSFLRQEGPKALRATVEHDAAALVWVDEMYSLIGQEHFEQAIDILFEKIDDLLLAGEMRSCNDLLRTLDLNRMRDSRMLLGLLSITRAAASELEYRRIIVTRVEVLLRKTHPERVGRLLSGLR
jgi:hypothetical protein